METKQMNNEQYWDSEWKHWNKDNNNNQEGPTNNRIIIQPIFDDTLEDNNIIINESIELEYSSFIEIVVNENTLHQMVDNGTIKTIDNNFNDEEMVSTYYTNTTNWVDSLACMNVST